MTEKFSRLTSVECGPCPVFASYTRGICLITEVKQGKTSVRVVEKFQLGKIQCVNTAALRVARKSC